ncbi:MAG: twin-arginine translocation pathway signal protein [Roseibium sp.]
MKQPEKATPEEGAGRRDFLKLAALSAPVAVAAATASKTAEAAEPDLLSEKMQDTAHTRSYYDSARF